MRLGGPGRRQLWGESGEGTLIGSRRQGGDECSRGAGDRAGKTQEEMTKGRRWKNCCHRALPAPPPTNAES